MENFSKNDASLNLTKLIALCEGYGVVQTQLLILIWLTMVQSIVNMMRSSLTSFQSPPNLGARIIGPLRWTMNHSAMDFLALWIQRGRAIPTETQSLNIGYNEGKSSIAQNPVAKSHFSSSVCSLLPSLTNLSPSPPSPIPIAPLSLSSLPAYSVISLSSFPAYSAISLSFPSSSSFFVPFLLIMSHI